MNIKKLWIFSCIVLIGTLGFSQYQPNPDSWNFYNFDMTEDEAELWDLFSKAFLGVAQTMATASAEDLIFFDKVIRPYGGHGNCFGMSLLSLICYREGGHLGACSPVYKYEGDLSASESGPDLDIIRESIGIMHLRQLSQPMISKLIDLFNDENWNDPEYAYGKIGHLLSSGDLPLLSFMPSSIAAIEAMGAGAEAHTVVPYKCEDTGDYYRIHVYDPNFPYRTETGFYTGTTKKNYIDIDKFSPIHPWKYPPDYDFATTSYGWNGSTSGPWTIIASSVSKAKYKTNHPLNAGFITGEIGTLIFSSGGSVKQVTDDEGRNFYKQVAGKIEFEKNPAKKTNNIIRWPFFHGKSNSQDVYFVRDMSGHTYDIQVDSQTTGYTCRMLLHGNIITLQSGQSQAGLDNLQIKSIGTQKQAIEISSNRPLTNVALELFRRLPDKKTTRTFKISELNIIKNSPVVVNLVDNLRSLQVESQKAAISYRVELLQRFKGKVTKITPQKVSSPAGQVQTISPTNWKDLKKAKINVKTRKLLKKLEKKKK